VNLSNKTLYRSLLLGAASAALASSAAFAQDAGVETVVVTGSLIQHTMGDQPIPTIIVDADAIAKTGKPNIAAVLAQLPQMQTAGGGVDLTPTNSNFLTAGFGVSNVDLRQLGATRTLVLVNGRRWITGSPTSSAVDLNTIPTQLIDRVETTTGGASAAYGSDAIAGVVNIILKQDFEGINATAQYGGTSRGDGGDAYGTLMVGGNFLEGKGNVTVVMSYENSQKISSGDRDITSTDSTHLPGLFPCIGTDGCFFLGSAYSSFGLGGRFRLAEPNSLGQVLADGSSFNPDGTTFNTAVNGFDRNPNRYIQVPVIRRTIAETAHLDIAPWLRFFVEGTYAYTSSSQQLEPYPGTSEDGLSKPTAAGGTGILVPYNTPGLPDNPFIPAEFIAAHPPGPDTQGLFFYRRFADLGDRTGRVDRDMGRVALGFEGDFGSLKNGTFLEDWRWSASYVWGRTAESQTNGGYYDKIKMQQALNARAPVGTEVAPAGGGGFVCDDPIAQAAGCVPINLFGAGSITPEAAAYVGSLVTLQSQAVEQVATVQANGSVFTLPAGAVKIAVGAEYRNENARFTPDAASQAGTVAGNQQPATSGAFDVKEVFGEGLLPVLKDLPFAEYVELNGAVRYAHYSTAGSATSWKYGATWQISSDLKFRGSEASATRAPNIAELFTPQAQTFPGISSDLCSNPSNANVAANCAAQIGPLGPGAPGEPGAPTYQGATGQAALQGVGGYTSGNPNLKPETAYTFTAGLVYTPSWLQGLQLTSDYYDIRIHGYIGSLDPQTTQQACYLADPSLFATNVFCQQIFRQHDSELGPIIKQINFPSFNLGSIKTSGVDTTITYAFDLGDFDDSLRDAGSFSFVLNTTYISHFDTDPGLPGTEIIKTAGDAGQQMWRGLLRMTYTNGPLEISPALRYVGPAYVSKEAALSPPANTTELEANRLPSVWYTDINVSYDVTEQIQGYVGVNNLFDVRPPETFPGAFDTTGTNTITDVYDPIGMFIYGGVNLKL
jgi:outer membrane receptor protein involved in Fe transport